MASSNPCVSISPRIKILSFLLSICTDELMTFFTRLPSVYKNSEQKSNHIPRPLYLYLSGSAFLVSFTDPDKQFLNVKSVFKFLNHGLTV